MEQREYKVGERFTHDGVTLECVEEPHGVYPCKGCFFDDSGRCTMNVATRCCSSYRADLTDVIFKQV